MKNLVICLFAISTIIGFAGCKKNDNTTNESANSKLIVGTYTATKVEGSNTNNGTDWLDITRVGAREILTIRADAYFNSVKNNPNTGATGTPVYGTWSLSADGNTLTYTGIQSYTLQTLTTTNMVTVLTGPDKMANSDAASYGYYRFTYTRQSN